MKKPEQSVKRSIVSPSGLIRIEVAVDTLWVGTTVHPHVLTWSLFFKGNPGVTPSFFRFGLPGAEPLAYGIKEFEISECSAADAPVRLYKVTAGNAKGERIGVTFALTDQKAVCSYRPSVRGLYDRTLTTFPGGASYLNPEADLYAPHLFFTPHGQLIAYQQLPFLFQAWCFERPGELATSRFPLADPPKTLEVTSAERGINLLFTDFPFWTQKPEIIGFSPEVTEVYESAFLWMASRPQEIDDTWMPRGEPGDFAILARRLGKRWQVAGLSSTDKVLTIRLEDLLRRTPEAERAEAYSVEIIRDPNSNESSLPSPVHERFDGLSPEIKTVLDIRAGGGFMLTFTPDFPGK